MQFLSYIGEWVSPKNPKDIVRAAFTYFWVKSLLMTDKEYIIQPNYSADLNEAAFVVKLLYQIGAGSIHELTENYFSGPDLHNKALDLISKQVLELSEKKLSSACSQLNKELSELLLELINLIDEKSGHLKFHLVKRTNPFMYEQYEEGCLAKVEINEEALRTMEELLAPIVYQECGLNVQKISGFWVEHHNKPIQKDDVQVVHCDQLAGMCYAEAYTAMEALSKSSNKKRQDQFIEFNTIYLLDDMIETGAAIAAYYPIDKKTKDLLSNVITILNDELTLKPWERADLFRKWSEQLHLWHEMGHLKTDDLIAQLIKENSILKNLFTFDENTIEIYADAYELKQLESQGNDLMRLFLIIRYINKGWLKDVSESKAKNLMWKHRDLFILRSLLMEKNPSSYLYELLNNMEKILSSQGKRIYQRWLIRKILQTKEEVLTELGKRFDL